MSEQMTPMRAEQALLAIGKRITEARDRVAELDEKATMAALRYELAYARSILRAEGGNSEARKASATLAVETELTDKVVAELALRAAKGMLASCTTQSDLMRSVSSSIRHSMSLS